MIHKQNISEIKVKVENKTLFGGEATVEVENKTLFGGEATVEVE